MSELMGWESSSFPGDLPASARYPRFERPFPPSSGAFDLKDTKGKLPPWAESLADQGVQPDGTEATRFDKGDQILEKQLFLDPSGKRFLVERLFLKSDLVQVNTLVRDANHGVVRDGRYYLIVQKAGGTTKNLGSAERDIQVLLGVPEMTDVLDKS
ncbi:hypothetical protein A2630_04280 [Candidatus Woesebacteria bacterium RIFCSPHIGHO2_01_FULL_44_10]|uniref:Uncharacterized protein n=1 Tax=Candidatus Woesebacteria bacterium RIFCSPLOWO2_01_FULL_44_14 TaxID=1802525 RepID=A0A1F8C1F0_9BACT|nr:MAG: hypothetical protein A2630_04280 [Candidatus Woesebacteria bacterium RIFCSPHIGHO2_01_FULL_44_10]OGM54684.1 MAG: hypothetical protein A3F62_02660 [Candidatus Woesebacteria bacterium RIFCSPHIGHO2_12_FULL_44_11]OGM70153.1 MAG: hypothetical protein A2975_03700 [Candidatus Woesebacteria bacterium RIFCSPLOWO2_01_FULL_44_14]